jgi:hypothetical protein
MVSAISASSALDRAPRYEYGIIYTWRPIRDDVDGQPITDCPSAQRKETLLRNQTE